MHQNLVPNSAELISLLKAQIEGKNKQIDDLQSQLAEKDKQIEKLQGQLERTNEALAEASHRHDTVVMQMTRLLEYHQQPFWRKLFSRKALPPPEQIMDMEPGGDNAKDSSPAGLSKANGRMTIGNPSTELYRRRFLVCN